MYLRMTYSGDMPIALTCPVCSASFTRKRAEICRTNCCSRSCSSKLNYPLHGVNIGRHNAPATEFQPGAVAHNKLPVGSVRIRVRHKRGGDRRAFVKIDEPNVWRERSIVVWESTNGARTQGRVIHHVNENSLDDRPENLVELTRAQHLAVHATSPSNISI
jgi:hypothetical protein